MVKTAPPDGDEGREHVYERLQNLLSFLPEKIQTLPPTKLFVFLGLIGAGLAIALVSLLWFSRGEPDQQVLYTQLTTEDTAAIVARLQEKGVPYTLQSDGTTIMVPTASVYELRLSLASEGLPRSGGVGFEIFDHQNFGMTEFMQKLNYKRALQGELSRTIRQLAAVEEARVHLVLPEKSLFLDQQEKTTASVVLKLAPGRRLNEEQIRGIAYLVARSVEGLHPADVIIVDNNGQMLNSEEENASFSSLTEAQLEYRKRIEQSLERRVEGLLERAVGKGKVAVRVSVTPDFQHIERTEERYDADNPAVRSEQRSKEQGTGPGFWAIGVPGVQSNLNQDPQNQQSASTTSSRQQETINYELSKVVNKIVAPSGSIKQLSVAVLIDGSFQTDEKGERQYVPRSAEEMAKYTEIVKGAVGYNESRGDRVEIANVPFEIQPNLEEEGIATLERWGLIISISRYVAYIILGILFFFFVIRPLIRWITGADETILETQLPRTVGELEADMGGEGILPESKEALKEPVLSPREKVIELVKADPERAAALVRLWLKGGGEVIK